MFKALHDSYEQFVSRAREMVRSHTALTAAIGVAIFLAVVLVIIVLA